MALFAETTENERMKEAPLMKYDYLTSTARYLRNGARWDCKLVMFTKSKSHTGFRLVSESVTLHDLERRNDHRRALSLRWLLVYWPKNGQKIKVAFTTDLYKYSSRCRTSYSRRIISCSHR